MVDLKICRICLIQDVKMYKHICYYEEIMNLKVHCDGVPQWFCYECATMLQKFHRFKQKCCSGLSILKALLVKGPLTSEIVYKINREINGLATSFQVTSNSNERVKTYLFKYKKSPSIMAHGIENLQACNTETYSQKSAVMCGKTNREVKRSEIENKCINVSDSPRSLREEMLTNNDDNNGQHFEDHFHDHDTENPGTSEDNKNKTDSSTVLLVNRDQNTESIRTRQGDKSTEANKFKRSIKKKFLNPNHWKKLNLTEDEAEREFKAKELNQKYLNAKYKCCHCFRGFSQEEMLDRHMKIKHCKSLGPFQCRFCQMRVKWKSRLQKHLKEHYKRYKCLRCELSFTVEDTAFKHDEFHNGVTKTCPHCGEKFKHTSTFYTHLRKHRSKHVCTLCGISFLSEFGLYMHKKVKHILQSSLSNEDQNASKSEENLFCEVCDIKFETQKAYDEHLTESARHTLITGEEDYTPQPFKCRYTQRRAPRKYTRCPSCGKNFSTFVAYSKHHLVEHPDTPLLASPYSPNIRKICEICGVSVAPVSLATHINTHTREKRYTCNICGTQLSSKSGLNRHRLTHTGEKPNKCNLCEKSFALTTNMKIHYRTVHMKELH